MPADVHHLKYSFPKLDHWVYCGLMKSISTSLGFEESKKAKLRFHILSLFYQSGFKIVKQAFPNLSKATVYRWKKTYENNFKRLNSLIPKSTRPRNIRKMQTPLSIYLLIESLRKQYPRMGKEKIKLFVDLFAKEQNLKPLSPSTIGKVIKRNNLFFYGKEQRKKRLFEAKKRIKFCPQATKIKPGYLQVDGVKSWYFDRYYYFLTAVEIVSKQAFVKLVPRLSSKQAALFLKEVILQSRIPIHTVQTDNGSEFEKYFKKAIGGYKLEHLFSYPHSPKTNGFVERFNWTVKDEFLFIYEDLLFHPYEFKKKLTDWLVYYNQVRPHQSLNYLTPYQFQENRGFCLKSV